MSKPDQLTATGSPVTVQRLFLRFDRRTWKSLEMKMHRPFVRDFFTVSLQTTSVEHTMMRLSPSVPRSPHVSAVHRQHDARGQDVPVAVHRMQVVQPLWHVRERRTYAGGRFSTPNRLDAELVFVVLTNTNVLVV